MEETRRRYQKLKQRYDNATDYFENAPAPSSEKEKFLQEFIDLLDEIRVVYRSLKLQEGQQSIN